VEERRDFSVATKAFLGSNGKLEKLHCVRLEWVSDNGRMMMKEVAGGDFELPAQLVLLPMGFISPETKGLFQHQDLKHQHRSTHDAIAA